MSDVKDFNSQMIDEFRANHGQLGGPFAGGTMLLLHHKGAKSGTERVNPLAYQPLDDGLRDLRVESGRSDEPRLVLQPQGQPGHHRRDRRRHGLGARPGRRGRRARQDLDQAGRADARLRRVRGEVRPHDPRRHPRAPLSDSPMLTECVRPARVRTVRSGGERLHWRGRGRTRGRRRRPPARAAT